jgi:hypothetical protein
MLSGFFQKKPGEAAVLDSIKEKLTNRGFEILEFKGVDMVARNPKNAGSNVLLIEVKAPKTGYITLDTVAQVNAAAHAYTSEFHQGKVKPIVIGQYTAAGSTQSVAEQNDVQLIQIDSGDTLGVITHKFDEELDKIITDVS